MELCLFNNNLLFVLQSYILCNNNQNPTTINESYVRGRPQWGSQVKSNCNYCKTNKLFRQLDQKNTGDVYMPETSL